MRDRYLNELQLAKVRFAERMLEQAALTAIPNLEEVAPSNWAKWSQQQYETWVVPAQARAREAIAWRDHLQARMGHSDRPNQCRPDPKVDYATVCRELGYAPTRRVHDRNGNWTGGTEPDPSVGLPETLLGEFEVVVQDGLEERLKYVPGAHPALWLGNARTYLGPPPEHLTRPPFFSKIPAEMHFSLFPSDWNEYSGIIINQCLLVRTRALELCSWCKQRLEAWDAAYYPLIIIGPDRNRCRTRSLKVFMADTEVALTRNRIPRADAFRLLSLKGGCEVDFDHRRYKDNLLRLIPPLSGLLRTVEPNKHTTPTTGGRYCLPPALRIVVTTD